MITHRDVGNISLVFIRDDADPLRIYGFECTSRDDRPLEVLVRRRGQDAPIVRVGMEPHGQLHWTLHLEPLVESHQGEIYYECLSPDAVATA